MLLYKGRQPQPPVPWQNVTFPPQDQEPANVAFTSGILMPGAVRDVARAAASAYAIACTFVPPETVSTGNVQMTQFAPTWDRPARSTYTIEQRPLPLMDPGIPAGKGFSETRPREEDRTALRSLTQQPRATWLEPGQPVQRGGYMEAQPRPLPSAPRDAYQTQGIVHPWDERPVSFGHVTDRARDASRAPTQAYWAEKKSQVDTDKPDSNGHVTDFTRQPQRAEIEAYAIIVPIVRDEPDIGRQMIQTDAVRLAARSEAAAYWIEPRVIALSVERPAASGPGSDIIAQPRAASAAYQLALGPPVAVVPFSFGYVEQITREAQRAERAAYWIEQWAFVGGTDQPASWGHQTVTAIAPPRAPSAAYGLNVTFVAPDPPVPGKQVWPDAVPAPQRSTAETYWRQVSFEIADPMPQGRGSVTDIARSLPRAPAEAYQLRGIQTVEEMPLARGWQPQSTRALDRSISVAYWLTQPPRTEERPPAYGSQTELARAPARAPAIAYQIPQRANSSGESAPASFGYIEQRPMVPPRAATVAYAMMPLSDPSGLDQPPANGYVEQGGRFPARAPAQAYQALQRADSAGESAPSAFGYQENRHMPLPRANTFAYVVSVRFSTPEILLVGTRVNVYGGSGGRMNVLGASGQVHGVYGDQGERGDVT